MKNKFALVMACLLLAATSTAPVRAAFTVADWMGAPAQTVGVATWDLTATTLPAGLGVTFADITLAPGSKLELQNTDGLLTHAASYTLDYTVSLSGGWTFTGVGVDSTTFGTSDVSKDVTWAPSGSLSVSAVNGTPSGVMAISGTPPPSSLTVHETITIGSDSVVTAFADTYTVQFPRSNDSVPDSGASGLLIAIGLAPLFLAARKLSR